MARDVIVHQVNDWSVLDGDQVWTKVDLSAPEVNFGIHKYQGKLWSSGYVGVGRLFGRDGRCIRSGGKEHIVAAASQYGLDPWRMLETVLDDDEYDDYAAQMDADGKTLFRVFYDQPLIRLPQDRECGGELLYALSFILSCYDLCRKGLKKTMFRREENYAAKVRGRIEIRKNIRSNTCKGRNDRFYCGFIDFTEDNRENRILKAALLRCGDIVGERFSAGSQVAKRLAYCRNAFRRVKTVRIGTSDFNGADASGLYMYYKPLLQQARCICAQKYYTFRTGDGPGASRSVFTVPYMINMESLFEFYARSVLKRTLDPKKYALEPYSRRLFTQRGVRELPAAERGIHLSAYCVPDIIVRDSRSQRPAAVIDAKYKPNARSERANTHQLLSYVLLTGVQKCGFIFPGTESRPKIMAATGQAALPLAVEPLDYYELILGNDPENAGETLRYILP